MPFNMGQMRPVIEWSLTIQYPVCFLNGLTAIDHFIQKKYFLLFLKLSKLTCHLKTIPEIE
jgi:hypothetical protein